MVMKVEFNDDEKKIFHSMHTVSTGELNQYLSFIQDESLIKNDLMDLRCILETLKKDTERCLSIVKDAEELMGENNGKDR